MDSRKRNLTIAAKHGCYLLTLFFAYVLQTVPGLFSIGGIKPVLLVPLAITIAAFEGEFVGALYGMLAGLLWEIAAGRTIGGFSILLLALCFVCGVSVALYLRRTVLNLSLLSAGCLLLLCSSDFIFSYWLQGYSGIAGVYFLRMLPTVCYSAALTFFYFHLVRRISAVFALRD
ncbi:MAG: rod shape-determining protein MreD [Pygmaiobacter sp.]